QFCFRRLICQVQSKEAGRGRDGTSGRKLCATNFRSGSRGRKLCATNFRNGSRGRMLCATNFRDGRRGCVLCATSFRNGSRGRVLWAMNFQGGIGGSVLCATNFRCFPRRALRERIGLKAGVVAFKAARVILIVALVRDRPLRPRRLLRRIEG